MPEYKFYTIRKDGHIAAPPVVYEAQKDVDALKEANRLLDGNDIEIWQGTRVVAYLTPDEAG